MVVNSAILHLKIRDDCLTPASQTPVLGWWGDASRHPPPPGENFSTQFERQKSQVLTCLRFFGGSQLKNVKSHVFLEFEKKRFLEHCSYSS